MATVKLAKSYIKQMTEAFAEEHIDQIEEIVTDAVEQVVEVAANAETSEDDVTKRRDAIKQALEPVAEQVAEIIGVAAEEVIDDLATYVEDKMYGSEDKMEETEFEDMDKQTDEEDEAMYETKAVQIQPRRFAKSAGAAVHNTGNFKTKSINLNRNDPSKKPHTLGRLIKAMRDHDYGYLSGHAKRVNSAHKALGINPDTSGGYLVAPEVSNEIIEVLRAKAKLMNEVTVVPMNNTDTMQIPVATTGSTSYFIGENAQITESQPAFGQRQLVVKKQATFVPISNELVEDSSPDADAFIRDDITKSMMTKFDQTILVGTGIGEPLGLLNNPDVTSTASSNPTSYADLLAMEERVAVENVDDTVPWKWILHPTAKKILRQIVDGNSQYIWTGSDGIGRQAAGGDPDELIGYGWLSTTLGGLDANSRPRLFFGNLKDVVVGMRKTIEIKASSEAGNAFQYDQTYIRAIMRWDMVLRHPESIEVLTALRLS